MIGSTRVRAVCFNERLNMLTIQLLYRHTPTLPKFVRAEYPSNTIVAAAGGQWQSDLSDQSAKLLLVEAEIRPGFKKKTRFRKTCEIGDFVFEVFVPDWSV